MAGTRLDIPNDIKRQVRTRCGGGCVICGLRVFEYDHIIEYNVVRNHKAANISLLCDRHHREKTSGRLDPELYASRNKNPFNKQIFKDSRIISQEFPSKHSIHTVGINGFSFSFEGSSIDCEIVEGNFAPLVNIDFQEVLSVRRQDELMLLILKIYDKDNNLLLDIFDGEIRVQSEVFDYDLVGDKVKIRSALGKIDFEFRLTGRGIHISRGSLYGGYGSKIEFSKRGAVVIVGEQNIDLPTVTGRNKSILILPNLIEIADVSTGGNIISVNYMNALYSKASQTDRKQDPDDYYFMQSRFLNCLEAVARANKDVNLSAKALPIKREFMQFCKETKRDIPYARSVRGLARELWRHGKENPAMLQESIDLLDEAITLPFIRNSKSNLARAKANLGESLFYLSRLTAEPKMLVRAREVLSEALDFYDKLPLVASEDADAPRIRSMIHYIDTLQTRMP